MRKNSIILGFLLPLAGWLMVGCDKQPQQEPGTVDKLVLSASLPDAGTKTMLNHHDDVYDVVWKTGDKISVNGVISNAVPSEYDGQKVVDFTVEGSLSAPFKVLYPGTGEERTISLPATQNYVADNIDGAAAASYGTATRTGDKYSAKLSNFCGILRFALNGSATLSRIELNSLGDECLYGDFDLTVGQGGFTGSFNGGTDGKLTYNIGGVTLSGTDTYFHIAIPAQAYASGIEALVYQADGAFMRLKFWGSGATLEGTDLIEFESKTFAAGRTENLLAINALTAEDGGEPTAEAPGITVATFNVMRLDSENRPSAATTGDSNGKIARPEGAIAPDCAEMQAALGQAIYNTGADIIGFNEIGDDMYATGLAHSLQTIASGEGASYTWKLDFPGSLSSGNYHYCNGFAYKASVLSCNESGRAWLRTGSESYSTSSDSNSGDPNRYVVWAKFTHKVSGKVFYFFVTQLPTYGQDGGNGTSNTNMSGGVNAFATAKAGSSPQILVGDFNSAPNHSNEAGYNKLKTYWTDAYEAVSAAGNLAPFYTTYSGTQSGTGDTYLYSILQFTKNHPERRIDHIMTHGACTAQTYRTVRNVYEFGSGENAVTCAPSDHLPVVSYITLD